MYFNEPLIQGAQKNIFYLAPIPVYMREFDDHDLHDEVFNIGFNELTSEQKLMGQELPEQYDIERQSNYHVNYDRRDRWVEPTEYNPIGSRFSVPPNDFLKNDLNSISIIKQRCEDGFLSLVDALGHKHNNNPKITESWVQYYNPISGRGHNQHNHCRWSPDEETNLNFVGGYYLNDGNPLSDHPYSGVFTFHIRGMSYFIRPKKGMLIIWPYDIVHSVKPFYGESHRCVINFNIQDGGVKSFNTPTPQLTSKPESTPQPKKLI
jgi:hypothetical protein